MPGSIAIPVAARAAAIAAATAILCLRIQPISHPLKNQEMKRSDQAAQKQISQWTTSEIHCRIISLAYNLERLPVQRRPCVRMRFPWSPRADIARPRPVYVPDRW